MKTLKDRAIVLSRIDYGEKDRIITLLCKENGQVTALARGVRAPKSRLAGGIELLSESEIAYIEGRSDIKPLISTRLIVHHEVLAGDLERMQVGFNMIRTIKKIIHEGAGAEFYPVLASALVALNDLSTNSQIVEIWFNLNTMKSSGSEPNLRYTNTADERFDFDYDVQGFKPSESGAYTKNDLKLLRLCLSNDRPPRLAKELGSEARLVDMTSVLLKMNVTEV